MQNKRIIGALIVSTVLIGTAILFSNKTPTDGTSYEGSAVLKDGVQYVDITARGGYSPKISKAKAGIPTVIRMTTENTYDCSSSLVIPDLKYQTNLKPTGVEEIQIPIEKTQGILKGMCSMAMYTFEIVFE